MINRNFKTVMLGWLMSSKMVGPANPTFNTQTVYNVEGTGEIYPPSSAQPAVSAAIVNALNTATTNNIINTRSANRLFMAIGTGTTEATEEDYTLETENTDIICETITQTYTQAYKRQITATFNNPTAQDIALKEVGLFYETYFSGEYNINTIMLARENIEVTIPAGETKAITMEIG